LCICAQRRLLYTPMSWACHCHLLEAAFLTCKYSKHAQQRDANCSSHNCRSINSIRAPSIINMYRTKARRLGRPNGVIYTVQSRKLPCVKVWIRSNVAPTCTKLNRPASSQPYQSFRAAYTWGHPFMTSAPRGRGYSTTVNSGRLRRGDGTRRCGRSQPISKAED
jgi:hypothetical protein